MLKNKVKKSFAKVRGDIGSFKRQMNDWIMFLDRSERDLKIRVRELEKRVASLEREKMIEVRV